MLKINCLAVSCEAYPFRVAHIIADTHATLGYFQTAEVCSHVSLMEVFNVSEASGHRGMQVSAAA